MHPLSGSESKYRTTSALSSIFFFFFWQPLSSCVILSCCMALAQLPLFAQWVCAVLPIMTVVGIQRVNTVVHSFTVVPGPQEVCVKCQRISLGTQRSKPGRYSITRLFTHPGIASRRSESLANRGDRLRTYCLVTANHPAP